jgi:hypothetical protein
MWAATPDDQGEIGHGATAAPARAEAFPLRV